jgi:L-fuconolactonase
LGVLPVTSIVDAHHHVWDLSRRDQPWTAAPDLAAIRRSFSDADLAAAVAGTGVTATVLVQVLNVAEETQDLLELAEKGDLIRAVVGWVDLADPAVADRLATLRAGSAGGYLVGVRHQMQAEPDPAAWLDQPAVRRGLRAVADAGLAYDLMIRPEQFEVARRTILAHPDVAFVLDHLGKPPIATGAIELWAAGIRGLAALPNLSCKLSGMVTVAHRAQWTVADLRPYAETALEAFGPDRVMFGSDWPVCLVAASYARVVTAMAELTRGLSDTERDLVFGGTAASVYRLAGR